MTEFKLFVLKKLSYFIKKKSVFKKPFIFISRKKLVILKSYLEYFVIKMFISHNV